MNVMTVGLLCIALYAVCVVAWLRYDQNKDYDTNSKGERS